MIRRPGVATPPPALRRFVSPRPRRHRAGPACERCGVPLTDRHRHVVDLDDQRLLCTCPDCAGRFPPSAARYRPVPERSVRLEPFTLSLGQWHTLDVPVGVAFFLRRTAPDRTVAFYPSPAGATESELPLDAWADVTASNPQLQTLQPDTEAALVRFGERPSCYLVPVDRCYELVGRLRLEWRGFDGGAEARAHLDRFFAELDAESAGGPPPAADPDR